MKQSSSLLVYNKIINLQKLFFVTVFLFFTLTLFSISSLETKFVMAFDESIDIDVKKSFKGFSDCNDGDPNCLHSQGGILTNENPVSSEDAKIDQFLIQALNCDNNPDCSSNVFNGGEQITNLFSFDDSFVDADVEQIMIQKIDGENKDGFLMQNIGFQGFQISASDNSKVDADNSGDNVEMKMKQKNYRCDESGCINDARQIYDITAENNAEIDMKSNQGFYSKQVNKKCDDGVLCGNIGNQNIQLVATGNSELKFDTRGLNDLRQKNNCENGAFNCLNNNSQSVGISTSGFAKVDVDDLVQDSYQKNNCDNMAGSGCENTGSAQFIAISTGNSEIDAETSQDSYQKNNCENGSFNCLNDITQTAGIATSGFANVDVDDLVQDSYQKNNCDNMGGSGCENTGSAEFIAISTDNSEIDAETSQDSYQKNNCENGSFNCLNDITQTVGMGTSGFANVDVDDLVQDSYQKNNCDNMGGSGCENTASIDFSATSSDQSTIDAEAFQEVSQKNNCVGGVCNNDAIIISDLSSNDNSYLNSESSQTIDQSNDCIESLCNNAANSLYFVHTQDGAMVYSDVTQETTQANECTDGAICSNTSNQIYSIIGAENSISDIKGAQSTNQSCNVNGNGFCSGTINSITAVTSTGDAKISLDTVQNFDSNDSGEGFINAVFDNNDFGAFSETQTETGEIEIDPQ